MNVLIRLALLAKKISLIGLLGLGLSGAAWALDFKTGDFQTINGSRTGTITVWQLAENDAVFVFDFPGLTAQGKSFNRATQLLEQLQGNVGYPRVMSDRELQDYMLAIRRNQANFAFGHDFLISELVQFFNLADRDHVTLSAEEQAVRAWLIDTGLAKVWRGFMQAIRTNVVVLSIPQTQAKSESEPLINAFARETILKHELAHAEYYTNELYANYCRKFWDDRLSEAEKNAFMAFLKNDNYDVTAYELVVNEMQAYLMFTADPLAFSAEKLGVSPAELAAMRVRFYEGHPPSRLF